MERKNLQNIMAEKNKKSTKNLSNGKRLTNLCLLDWLSPLFVSTKIVKISIPRNYYFHKI